MSIRDSYISHGMRYIRYIRKPLSLKNNESFPPTHIHTSHHVSRLLNLMKSKEGKETLLRPHIHRAS